MEQHGSLVETVDNMKTPGIVRVHLLYPNMTQIKQFIAHNQPSTIAVYRCTVWSLRLRFRRKEGFCRAELQALHECFRSHDEEQQAMGMCVCGIQPDVWHQNIYTKCIKMSQCQIVLLFAIRNVYYDYKSIYARNCLLEFTDEHDELHLILMRQISFHRVPSEQLNQYQAVAVPKRIK